MSTIGDNIKEQREKSGISQQQLADELGYKSKSTINKIESGVNDITQSKILAFAKALKIPPSRLMGWTADDEAQRNKRIYDLNTLLSGNNAEYIFIFIGKLLKNNRISWNLTEKTIAVSLDIPLEKYLSLENGDGNVDATTIEKAVALTGEKFYYFYGVINGIVSIIDAVDNTSAPDEILKSIKKNLVNNSLDKLLQLIRLNSYSNKLRSKSNEVT